MGFDYDPHIGGQDCNDTATFTFTAAEDQNLLTVALVWHLAVDGGITDNYDGTAVLRDLDLSLTAVDGGALVATSTSRTENTEHLFMALEKGRTYELTMAVAPGVAAFDWDYALAWCMGADADRDLIPDDLDNCRLTTNRGQLDSDEDGYGDRCDCDLTNDGVVNAGDFWIWRLLATVNPASIYWEPATDFNGSSDADLEDYHILLSRIGDEAPFE